MDNAKKEKQWIAFISYASEDRELAFSIQRLLKVAARDLDWMLYDSFIDRPSLKVDFIDPNWKNGLIDGLKQSHCIIPIITRHSISKPWLSFELGAAEALGMKKFPVIVAGVNPKEIPCNETISYELYDQKELIKLVKNVLHCTGRAYDVEQLENILSDQISLMRSILKKAKERWVYIIGSRPKNINDEDIPEWDSRANSFLRELSKKLLSRDFYLASFPLVENVGNCVAQVALGNSKYKDRYRIAGIFQFDETLRKLAKEKDLDEEIISEILRNFRKSYLTDKEYLLMLGGQIGTKEEFEVANELKNIKIVPVPCFAGFSEELWRNMNDKSELKDYHCSDYNDECKKGCKNIDNIVRKIEEHYLS